MEAQNASCKLIIFLDDALKVDEYGNVVSREENDYYRIMKKACEENNIIFVDMHNEFSKLYKLLYKFPHGFSNTKVGVGHLNKYGHATIANTLFEIISEREGL